MTVQEAPPISELLDARTVQSIADEVWPSLVGDGEAFVPVPVPPPTEAVSAWVDMTRPPTVVDDEDVADALGELANVLGGNIKSVLPGESRLGLPQIGVAPPHGRLDDVRSLVGQWRGNFLTITVQGAAPAPHAERNEVPL
jgi:chemotaxis protein CheX